MRTFRTVAALTGVFSLVAMATQAVTTRPAEEPGSPAQMMHDASHQVDMRAFHYLLENRTKITRSVTNLPNGIDTLTRSADAEVVATLKGHVASMAKRMEDAKNVTINIEPLPDGVRVIETSDDAYTVRLLQEHARIVDRFLQNGMVGMHRDHPLPPRPEPKR